MRGRGGSSIVAQTSKSKKRNTTTTKSSITPPLPASKAPAAATAARDKTRGGAAALQSSSKIAVKDRPVNQKQQTSKETQITVENKPKMPPEQAAAESLPGANKLDAFAVNQLPMVTATIAVNQIKTKSDVGNTSRKAESGPEKRGNVKSKGNGDLFPKLETKKETKKESPTETKKESSKEAKKESPKETKSKHTDQNEPAIIPQPTGATSGASASTSPLVQDKLPPHSISENITFAGGGMKILRSPAAAAEEPTHPSTCGSSGSETPSGNIRAAGTCANKGGNNKKRPSGEISHRLNSHPTSRRNSSESDRNQFSASATPPFCLPSKAPEDMTIPELRRWLRKMGATTSGYIPPLLANTPKQVYVDLYRNMVRSNSAKSPASSSGAKTPPYDLTKFYRSGTRDWERQELRAASNSGLFTGVPERAKKVLEGEKFISPLNISLTSIRSSVSLTLPSISEIQTEIAEVTESVDSMQIRGNRQRQAALQRAKSIERMRIKRDMDQSLASSQVIKTPSKQFKLTTALIVEEEDSDSAGLDQEGDDEGCETRAAAAHDDIESKEQNEKTRPRFT